MKDLIKTTLLIILSIILIINITFINHDFKRSSMAKEIEKTEKIVFFGDSLVERYNTDEFLTKYKIINNGKGGATTEYLLDELEEKVIDINPDKVFILIGTNDLNGGFTEQEVIENLTRICDLIKEQNEDVKIYIESIYPINEELTKERDIHKDVTNKKIISLNKKIKKLCKEKQMKYIDVFSKLIFEDNLKDTYTADGLHLNDIGYYHVTELLKKYL